MKIGLAIAPANASPLAFVVFREDLKVSISEVRKIRHFRKAMMIIFCDYSCNSASNKSFS